MSSLVCKKRVYEKENVRVPYSCNQPVPIKVPSKIEENQIKALWPVIIKYESAFAVRVGVSTGGTDWTVAVPASRKISVWAPMRIVIQSERHGAVYFNAPCEKPIFLLYEGDLGSPARSLPLSSTLFPSSWCQYTIYRQHASVWKKGLQRLWTDLLCSTNTCRLIVLTPNRWNGRSDSSGSGWSNNSTPETQHVHVRNSTSISYLEINEQQKPWSRYLQTVPNPTTW